MAFAGKLIDCREQTRGRFNVTNCTDNSEGPPLGTDTECNNEETAKPCLK